jgi:hypothetical protein
MKGRPVLVREPRPTLKETRKRLGASIADFNRALAIHRLVETLDNLAKVYGLSGKEKEAFVAASADKVATLLGTARRLNQ